ncbi:helix-turn-helix domain-containing protein [Streptomyces sp. NPDC050704]|uniref:helix-turn-helix transcriptional regulator n=1 Tax=Streptomyces sp. NPDC050704 TaxID=3157219 RepID=UPI00341843EC
MPRPAKTPTQPPPGHVWTPEAAHRMGVTVKTLWNYRHLGKGPKPVVRGRKLAYPIDQIDAWLEAQDSPDPQAEHDSRPPEARSSPRKKPTDLQLAG